MSFVDNLKNDFIARDEAVKGKKSTWRQFLLIGFIDFMLISTVQMPLIRDLQKLLPLSSGLWTLASLVSIYFVNRVVYVMVMTWNADLRRPNAPSPPTQIESIQQPQKLSPELQDKQQ